MEVPNEKIIIGTNGIKKVLLRNLLVFVGFGFLGPLILAFEISRAPEELGFPSVGSVVSPAFQAFAIGLLISLVIGKWPTSRLVTHYKNQHFSQGLILAKQNSFFQNFGFDLGIGTLIGTSLLEFFICHDLQGTEEVPSLLTTLFYCRTILHSVTGVFVGMVTGLGVWMIYQVTAIEKETNQKMMVQFYSTGQWSWIVLAGASAVAAFVVVLTFYKIFTLGQP